MYEGVINAYVTNLGRYNEGCLVGESLACLLYTSPSPRD